jgi:hypothetical protein
MIDPGWAAVIASFVSLVLGTVGIWRSYLDSRQSARRERDVRRAEALVDVLRLVERRGVAIQDQIHNLTEVDNEDSARWEVTLPRREVNMPSRNDRAEARALLAAHGTADVKAKFAAWLEIVDSWENKLAEWSWDGQVNGEEWKTPQDAEPERTNERVAREALGEAVSAALGEGPSRPLQKPRTLIPLEKKRTEG